jgi:5-methylcytosine-specific restriction endonuclease McrA
MSRYDRSEQANQYRKHYSTKAWAALRRRALLRDGFRCQHEGCNVILRQGRDHPNSAVVHHLTPHKGDLALFYDLNNLQSVCWRCHSGDIQSQEVLGYSKEVGLDGWPVDPRNPAAG